MRFTFKLINDAVLSFVILILALQEIYFSLQVFMLKNELSGFSYDKSVWYGHQIHTEMIQLLTLFFLLAYSFSHSLQVFFLQWKLDSGKDYLARLKELNIKPWFFFSNWFLYQVFTAGVVYFFFYEPITFEGMIQYSYIQVLFSFFGLVLATLLYKDFRTLYFSK